MLHNPQRIAGTVAALATVAGLAYAGPRPITLGGPATGDEAISSALREHSERGDHGLSAFVYDNGHARFGGVGADENTEVEIGSVTKTFNAELLRQEIEEGSVSLGTTVGELADVGDSPVADVTLEELVNHTSGLSTMEGIGTMEKIVANIRHRGNAYRRDTPDDIIDTARSATLHGRGERHYSNYGQALLGQLLARNAGTDYNTLLRTRILEPAGMTSTRLATPGSVDEAPRGLTAAGRPAEPWDMDGWAPAGAIRSTAGDMARYVDWVARHGRTDYGWTQREFNGTDYTFHNGGTGGFRTMLLWDPDSAEPRAAFVANDSARGVEKLGVDLLTSTREENQ